MFADWAPSLELSSAFDECPLYLLRAPADQFGCSVNKSEYGIPKNVSDIIGQRGYVDIDMEIQSPMLAMMVQEAHRRDIHMRVKSMSVMRRGECTFVEKAKTVAMLEADAGSCYSSCDFVNLSTCAGLLVNSENKLLDMPAGKENTTNCSVPFAAASEGNGYLVFLSAMKFEVLAIVSPLSNSQGIGASCLRVRSMAEDIINLWPHSIPHMPIQQVLTAPEPSKKLRSPTDEGGRLAGTSWVTRINMSF